MVSFANHEEEGCLGRAIQVPEMSSLDYKLKLLHHLESTFDFLKLRVDLNELEISLVNGMHDGENL